MVDPPADLAAGINHAGLRATWDTLSYSNQREQAEAVESAKRPETRERHIVAALATMAR